MALLLQSKFRSEKSGRGSNLTPEKLNTYKSESAFLANLTLPNQQKE